MKILNHNIAAFPNFSGHPAFVVVVLVEGEIGDCAVYAGIVVLPGNDYEGRFYDSGRADFQEALRQGIDRVAFEGSKLRFAEAKQHFPMILESEYRP